jgi:Ca2+-binding RTX toxin-like protein
MALSVAPGSLDSLLNTILQPPDYTDFRINSFTTSSNDLTTETVTSLNVTATGPDALVSLPGSSLKVVAVNDSLNTITLAETGGSASGQVTEYVIGYAPNAILVSGLNSNLTATTISNNKDPAALMGVGQILTTTPTAAGTSFVFTANAAGLTPTPTPAPTSGLSALDTTTNHPVSVAAQIYTGPVVGVQNEFIDVTADNLNISVGTPNWFIHSGSGNDALTVSSGTNVLDGGTGSNFLSGGSGSDTFFVDDRTTPTDIWSTVNNFHAGDAATIFGVTTSSFNLAWDDNQGAAGFTGLTLHATATGVPTASLTLVGFTSADLADGKLSVSFGTTGGSPYMYVHDNG